MTDFSISGTTRAVSEGRTAPRLLFIDNIRWTMIVLVLSMHGCDTYSPFGNWYYVDRRPAGLGTTIFFGVYQSFLQAFFMAVLFFIAGYFSAAAYDRKGFSPFLRDRFFRLGLPTLLYLLVIGPLTQYFLSWTWGSGGFGHQWLLHLRDGEWLSETGPMWFCAALLIFAVVYALVRLTGWKEPRIEPAVDHRGGMAVAIFIAIMAASTFLVRTGVHGDASVLNMHPGASNISSCLPPARSAIGATGSRNFPSALACYGGRSRFPLQPRCWQRLSCLAVACRARPRSMPAGSIR
jgi:Acyltransferase family